MEVDLVLRVRLRSYSDVSLTPDEQARLGEILSRDEWSDGRYPFAVELTQEGLGQMLLTARRQLVWEEAVKAYPGNSDEAIVARRAYCEAREGREGLPALTVGCDFAFRLEAVEEEQEKRG